MQRLCLLFAPLVFLSCGTHMKRAATPPLQPMATLGEVAFLEREREREPEQEDSYEEAAEFYLLKRAPDGRNLPVERYIEAKRHTETMRTYSLALGRPVDRPQKGAARDASVGAWQSLGPGNVGGRTRSLLIHPADPNTMYAGSVSGGVWKTTDGGASWAPLTDLLPSIGIGAMAIDPKNPDVLYAGTGEWYTGDSRGNSVRGAGIFKSTDAGATWTQLAGTASSSFYYSNKIVVSPNDSSRVYVATWGGVWFSADAGATWRRVLDRTSPNTGCQDLVIRTDQPNDYLFAACGTSAAQKTAVFRNVNAGASGAWESVLAEANMGRTSLALAPSNQGIVYAISASTESGERSGGLLAVYRSNSNGDSGSWTPQVTNKDANRLNTTLLTNPRGAFADVCTNGRVTFTNQGGYDNSIAVDPLNPDVVWVGGIDVFRSDDGGKNWGIAGFWEAPAPQLTHADVHGLIFSPGYNGNDNQTLFVISDGGIYRTDNANAETAKGQRAACAPYATKVEWRNFNNGYSVTQFYHGAVYPGGAAYIGGAQDNGTHRGSDAAGPQDWRRVIGGDGGFVAIDPNDPNLIFGESQNLAFVRSTNGVGFSSAVRGITEDSANFLFIVPFEMDPSESKRLYIGGKTLWRTTDSAQNWTEASSPIPNSSGGISAIGISPSDPNQVVFGTSTGFVYRSTNALTSDKTVAWAVSQPRSGFLSHLAFDPVRPEIVYATYSQFKTATAQNHVYKSEDGGVTWKGIDGAGPAGLPDIPVFSLVVDPQNTSNLYLGTDIGLFVSTDAGSSWSRDDNPFANTVIEKLVLDRSAGQSILFAFTHGRGVWKVVLPGSGNPCQYDVTTSAPDSLAAFGGTVAFEVETGDNCAWSAVSTSSFALVQSPAGGKGSGSFAISTATNTSANPRSANLFVQDKTLAIRQNGALAASGNDESASAFPITSFPAVVVQPTGAGTEAESDPVHSCTRSKDLKTLWFKVTPTDAGTMAVRFTNRRVDTGTNAGTVMALYNVTANGAVGSEFGCLVIPQSGTQTNTNAGFATLNVRQGQAFFVQISATTSGAPDGAQALGGNLTLTVTLTK